MGNYKLLFHALSGYFGNNNVLIQTDLDFYSLNDANYFVNIYLIHFVETTLVIHLYFLIDVGVKHRVDRVGSPYSFLIVCCDATFCILLRRYLLFKDYYHHQITNFCLNDDLLTVIEREILSVVCILFALWGFIIRNVCLLSLTFFYLSKLHVKRMAT